MPAQLPTNLPQPVADYLVGHHVMTLATQGPEGPWASAVFYASDGHSLVFLSAPKTRHCRNLTLDARCAATIQEDYREWPEIKGIQLEGQVMRLEGADEARARELYGMKFPIAGPLAMVPPAIVEALAKVSWYRLVPSRLHFIDNSKGFGHRDEIELGRS